jgi:hypothetical protein
MAPVSGAISTSAMWQPLGKVWASIGATLAASSKVARLTGGGFPLGLLLARGYRCRDPNDGEPAVGEGDNLQQQQGPLDSRGPICRSEPQRGGARSVSK